MLEPLTKWYCDTCGELIENPEEGYVQFKRENNGLRYEDFKIVHHLSASPLKNKRRQGCYVYDSDCDLKHFLGSDGLATLLSFIDVGPYHSPKLSVDITPESFRVYSDFFKRLQLPYYEEARRYWDRGIADGYFDGQNDAYIYKPKNLKCLIETYEREDDIE